MRVGADCWEDNGEPETEEQISTLHFFIPFRDSHKACIIIAHLFYLLFFLKIEPKLFKNIYTEFNLENINKINKTLK